MYLKYRNLLAKGFKPAQNKLFMLSRDGCEVYRLTPFGYTLSPIYKHRYSTVSATVGGKQKTFILHRLIAEAFVPNPNNYPVVLHSDDDNHNNHANNLLWATNAMRLKKALAKGKGNSIKNLGVNCAVCGEPTLSKKGVCHECRKNTHIGLMSKKKQEALSISFENVDTRLLNPRDKEIVKMRMQGKTLKEIGKKYGISGESVRHIINRAAKYGEEGAVIRKNQIEPDYDTYIASLKISKFLKNTHINLALIARTTGLSYQRLYGKVVRRGCFEKEELEGIQSYLTVMEPDFKNIEIKCLRHEQKS